MIPRFEAIREWEGGVSVPDNELLRMIDMIGEPS